MHQGAIHQQPPSCAQDHGASGRSSGSALLSTAASSSISCGAATVPAFQLTLSTWFYLRVPAPTCRHAVRSVSFPAPEPSHAQTLTSRRVADVAVCVEGGEG